MTAEAKRSTNYYRLNGGLNTEFNELGFPEGFTTDEANYELLVDGSRRRRKGLAEESGGSSRTVATHTTSEFHQSYVWRNVGGDPTKDIVVYRKGTVLHFAPADETVSDAWVADELSFEDFKTTGATTANVDNAPVSFAHGRGRLLVTGQYIYPFYIEYDSVDGYVSNKITMRVRDFTTIDDGTPITNEPTASPIPDDHRFNLRNRGWSEADLTSFNSLSKWPARNAIWYKGYIRKADQSTASALVAEADGTREWNSTKMDAEVFGQSSAPVGALLLDPFDTTAAYAAGQSADSFDISTWVVVAPGETSTPWSITLTLSAAHGLTHPAEFTIDGNSFSYIATSGGRTFKSFDSLDGVYTTTSVPAVDELRFTWVGISGWDSWTTGPGGGSSQYNQLGIIDGGPIVRSSGTAHTDSLRAVAWHAGRAFYAGFSNEEFVDSIFYSQVVDNPNKLGKCYQEADPTDETFNAIVATDGGEIVIPGLGSIIDLVPLRNSLLVFSRDGVWEVSGGRGVFQADNFTVRKITDEGSSSSTSITRIDNSIIYTGPGGIYVIAPNQYTGILEAQNLILQTIQTKWNQLATTEQERCQAFYDDSLKRIYFLVRGSHSASTAAANAYDEILVFDSKIAAWSRYTFAADGLLTGFSIPSADDPTTNKKAKFIYKATSTTIKVADFSQTLFDDWDGSNGPLPYMYTGWDLTTSYQSRRQAPIIVVHSKRTETGYTASGNGWAATNPSSTTMTAYWDWADDDVTNKIGDKDGNGQEVYRHVRDFVPASASDVNGYPVVTTRNKVRGRGRALQLKFEGATDKDSHLLGFTVNYKVSRRI